MSENQPRDGPTTAMGLDVRNVATELIGVGAALHAIATGSGGDAVAVDLLAQSVAFRVAFVARCFRAFDVPGDYLRIVKDVDPRMWAIAAEVTEAFGACSRFAVHGDLVALEETLTKLGAASGV